MPEVADVFRRFGGSYLAGTVNLSHRPAEFGSSAVD